MHPDVLESEVENVRFILESQWSLEFKNSMVQKFQ